MSIIETLKHNRPDLKANTIYSYCSSLSSLYKKVFGTNDIDMDKFNDTNKILEELGTRPLNSKKTLLSMLYVLTNNDEYRKQMMEEIDAYNKNVSKQEMNEKQVENFKSQDEITDLLSSLKEEATLLYKKKQLSPKDKQQIQQFIILCLTCGHYIVPRRALDWCAMVVNEPNKQDDNYIDKNAFVFNKYKGSDKKGQQKLAIPKELKAILNKWISIADSKYLLHDSNGNQLTSVKLNQRLNKIFGGKTAINSLRHSYLSTKFQDSIKLNDDLQKTMNEMGSSSLQSKVYIQTIPK